MINISKYLQKNIGLIKSVLLVEVIILIVSSLFWWFAGDHSKRRFVDVLFVTGAIAIIIGYMIRSGCREGTYNLTYHYARLFGGTTRDERVKQDVADMYRSFSDFILLFVAGMISIIVSVVIYITL